MRAPAIDCVVPTHGRPHFLAECLSSVAAQTSPPALVVVVSDDGDHRSREVVEEFRRAHPQLSCCFLDRSAGRPGASASRNAGARQGSAPLIAFLDDDDLWEPAYLQSAAGALAATSCDAVVTAFRRFSAAGPGAVVVPDRELSARDVFRRAAGVTGSSIVVRRPVFDDLDGFDVHLPVQNDRDFFLRLLTASASYQVVADPLVQVRDHSGGRLTDASAMRADGVLVFLGKHGWRFGRRDRRVLRYVSHRTRMSSRASTAVRAKSTLLAIASWSPTAGRQIPLGLLRPVGVIFGPLRLVRSRVVRTRLVRTQQAGHQKGADHS